ncbi:rRNA-processing protein FCF1 homolog isoform X2 [Prionailurus iriomotensis]
MKRMLSLRDQRLPFIRGIWRKLFPLTFGTFESSEVKEKDRLKPKKKEKERSQCTQGKRSHFDERMYHQKHPQHPSCLFFQYNTQLGPPYHILVDTNFINFSIKAKLDLVQSMMDCLYAKFIFLGLLSCSRSKPLLVSLLYGSDIDPLKGIPCITDCVMAEIEKLGQKYRVALRVHVGIPCDEAASMPRALRLLTKD